MPATIAAPEAQTYPEIHPFAKLFPELKGEDFEEMKNDIDKNGLQHPIMLFQGKVIDGRNRLNCLKALDLPFDPENDAAAFEGTADQLLDFVVSLNMVRRHLSASQRAMIAAKIASLAEGGGPDSDDEDSAHKGNGKPKPPKVDGETARVQSEHDASGSGNNGKPVTVADASKQMNVSERSTFFAKQVLAKCIPEVQQAVEQDVVTVRDAAKIAEMSEKDQRKAFEKLLDGKAETLVKAAESNRKPKGGKGAAAEDEGADLLTKLQEPYKTALNAINVILREFKALSENPKEGAFLPWQRIQGDLGNAKAAIGEAMPYEICECEGKGCRECRKAGFHTKGFVKQRGKEGSKPAKE